MCSIPIYNSRIEDRNRESNKVTITPIALAERNYLKGVLRAFLNGKKNQNYVIGCFRNVPIAIYDMVASELAEYSEMPRFKELYQIRKKLEKALSECESRTRWSPWVLGKY
ncbi:MAG: hypothetical protein ACW99V_05625 [Candidatus Thorarchaeota archaeon]|jgi:hypothetical protein